MPASKALVAEAKAGGYDVVGSCHDFTATPSAAQITQKLAQITAAGADITKVAYMPRTAQDVAALRHAAHDFAGAYPYQPLIAISMGQLGAPSRTDLVNCLTFATIADGAASAPRTSNYCLRESLARKHPRDKYYRTMSQPLDSSSRAAGIPIGIARI